MTSHSDPVPRSAVAHAPRPIIPADIYALIEQTAREHPGYDALGFFVEPELTLIVVQIGDDGGVVEWFSMCPASAGQASAFMHHFGPDGKRAFFRLIEPPPVGDVH